MAEPMKNVIAKLEHMLALAEAGKLTHIAYHHNNDGSEEWGFLNVSDHGQLLIPARLSALAVKSDDPDDNQSN